MIESIKKINEDVKSEKTDSDIENVSGGVPEGVSDERSEAIYAGAKILASAVVGFAVKYKNSWIATRDSCKNNDIM